MNGYLVWCPALGQTQADGEVYIAGAPRHAATAWAGRWGNLRAEVCSALSAAPNDDGNPHRREVVYEVLVAGNGQAIDARTVSRKPWGSPIACKLTITRCVAVSAVAPLRSPALKGERR